MSVERPKFKPKVEVRDSGNIRELTTRDCIVVFNPNNPTDFKVTSGNYEANIRYGSHGRISVVEVYDKKSGRQIAEMELVDRMVSEYRKAMELYRSPELNLQH